MLLRCRNLQAYLKPSGQFDLGCVFVLVFVLSSGLNLREREQTVVETVRERKREREGSENGYSCHPPYRLISVMADFSSMLSPVCPPESSTGYSARVSGRACYPVWNTTSMPEMWTGHV